MAGEWIKVQNVTPDKPEVFIIADRLGIDPDAVIGKLIRVWIWADQQTTDGNAASVTKSLLDRISGVSGFADAMQSAGWLANDGGLFRFPNFDRHNGQTSKTRALASKRVEKHRGKSCNAETVTKALPEKRREEKNKECPTDTPAASPRREVSGTEIQVVADEWNMLGSPFAQVAMVANKRRTALRNRLANDWWRENWRAGLARVRGSPFCRGGGESGWVATFDWFVRPDTLTKVLEGNYDARIGTGKSGNGADATRVRSATTDSDFANIPRVQGGSGQPP